MVDRLAQKHIRCRSKQQIIVPIRVRLTFLICLLLPSLLQAAGIVLNGGFEIGTIDPWYQANDPAPGMGEDWNVTSDEAHSGLFSATNVGNKEIRQDFGATATSMITEFSFWIKHPAGAPFLFASFFYSDGTNTGISLLVNTTDWQFFNITNRLAAGKELTGFSVYGFDGTATPRTHLDDVTATIVPEPGTFTLTAVSLLLVFSGSRVRRKPAAR